MRQVEGRRDGGKDRVIATKGGVTSSRLVSARKVSARKSARASVWGGIESLLFCLLFFSSAPLPSLRAAGKPKSAQPEGEPKRTVTFKVALADPFGIGIDGKREVRKLNSMASVAFSRAFGIEFQIITWETWKVDKTLNTMPAVLNDFKRKVGPGEADVVIGVLGPSGPTDSPAGIADYFNGYVLLRLGQPGAAVRVAIHELGHIFGAVDLDEKNTIMNPRDPGWQFDTFSTRVISLNKDRSFHTQRFPSPRSLIKEVIAEYEGRASLKRSEPEIQLFLAYLYIETEDYASASKACTEVLKVNAGLTEIHSLLGNLYLAQGRTDEAIAEYRKVLEWNRELPVAHFNLGIACVQVGKEDEATSEFREAVRLNPNYAEAHASLGQQLLKRGEVDAALDHARTAVKIFPDFPEGLCILGTALILKESESLLEEAATICRKAAALRPELPEAHSILGVACGFMGKEKEAEAELLKALELKPDSLAAHLNLAVLYRKTGREEEATYHLGRVVKIGPDFAARHGLLTAANAGPIRYSVWPEMFWQK